MAAKNGRYVCVDDFETEGVSKLSGHAVNYYQTGADGEFTLSGSREAFRRYRLRPKILRNVSQQDLSTTILGQRINFPVCIAPTAFHRMATHHGEKATAKAARKADTVMVLSMISNTTIEDMSKAVPGGLHLLNVYFMKNLEITKHFVREAERCGYCGIVLTIDSPILGYHFRTARSGFGHHAADECKMKLVNFDIPHIPELQEYKTHSPLLLGYFPRHLSSSVTIDDVKWLKSFTKLPVICKGVLTAESARELAEAGVDGILVSAHGGRQLDHVPAPIDVIADVVNAVKGYPVEVYMDGGIRTGTDIFKALARGARAVFIGRPIIWGLASKGEEGVTQVLDILREEFSRTMALTGCSKLSDIDPSMVVHESYYYNSKL